MKTVTEIIADMDWRFSRIDGPCVISSEDWQTLKADVLAQQSTNSAMDAIAALRDLYEACMWADRDAMLPGNIDGKLLDRAKTVLQQHQ